MNLRMRNNSIRVVAATRNPHKAEEIFRILHPLGVNVVGEGDLGITLSPVEETGTTFRQNAFLKAKSACRETGLPAVADDSGLCVDALGGAPGVYSARYAPQGQRKAKLLEAMREIPPEKRTARFVCAVCCVFPNGDVVAAQGECAGFIACECRGDGGFGYDPIFLVGNKTFAELSDEEKDMLSHRGKALRRFAAQLNEYLGRSDLLTGKQRAFLRGCANTMTPILHIGKEGVTQTVIKQADDALSARELIKGHVLEHAPLSGIETARQLACSVHAEVIQVIGRTFVLYRMNEKDPKFVLPR